MNPIAGVTMIKTFNPVPDEVQETLDCLTDQAAAKKMK